METNLEKFIKRQQDFPGFDENASTQANLVQFHLSGGDNELGYVGDLLESKEMPEELVYLYSLARGCNSVFGELPDMDLTNYTSPHVYELMLSTVLTEERGPILDLDPLLYTAEQMRAVSRGRGTGSYYSNIDHLDPATTSSSKMEHLSFIGG